MPKPSPKRQPGQTWPGLDPGEGSPFDGEDDHDGELVEFGARDERKTKPAKPTKSEERPCRKRKSL